MNARLYVLVSALVGLGGCDATKASDSASGDKSDKKAGDAKGGNADGSKGEAKAPVKKAELVIEGLGLKSIAPAGTEFDEIGGRYAISGEGLILTVFVFKPEEGIVGETAEKAKANAKLDEPKEWKEHKLADGYYVTYKDGSGAMQRLKMARKIGDRFVACTAMTANDPKIIPNAIEFCTGLVPK